MYGFRKIVKGSESGCHVNPYFVRGKPENLQLIKRGTLPRCVPYYENRLHKLADVRAGIVCQDDNDNSYFSEPEMAIDCNKGQKRTIDGLPHPEQPCDECTELLGRCEAFNATDYNVSPPGSKTVPTNSSDAKHACNARVSFKKKKTRKCKSKQSSVYTELLDHLKLISGGHPSLIAMSDFENWQSPYSCTCSSSRSSPCSNTPSPKHDLVDADDSLETRRPSAIQNYKYNSEKSATEISDSFARTGSSSTLHDLADVAGSLASQRDSLSKVKQDTQSISDVQNGHVDVKSQLSRRNSLIHRPFMKADHDVTKEKEDPSVADAQLFTFGSKTKKEEHNFGHAAVADSRVEGT